MNCAGQTDGARALIPIIGIRALLVYGNINNFMKYLLWLTTYHYAYET